MSTPVRLVPPPCPMTSSPPHTLSPPLVTLTSTAVSPQMSNKATSPLHVQVSIILLCTILIAPCVSCCHIKLKLIHSVLNNDNNW